MKCDICNDELGDKELPFFVDGEVLCPQDFVHSRTNDSPHAHFQAVKCLKCGCVQVDCGLSMCGQCGFRMMRTLPAKHVKPSA